MSEKTEDRLAWVDTRLQELFDRNDALEAANVVLTSERDEAVRTAANLAVLNGSLKSQLDGFREGARIGRDASRRETAYSRERYDEAVRKAAELRAALQEIVGLPSLPESWDSRTDQLVVSYPVRESPYFIALASLATDKAAPGAKGEA